MRRMVLRRDAFVRGLGRADPAGKDDVAEQHSGPATICLRKSFASASGKERTLVGLSLPRQSAFSARTSSSPVKLDRQLDRDARACRQLREGAFGDRGLGRAADELRPSELATVPFLVGVDVDLEHHARPGPS